MVRTVLVQEQHWRRRLLLLARLLFGHTKAMLKTKAIVHPRARLQTMVKELQEQQRGNRIV